VKQIILVLCGLFLMTGLVLAGGETESSTSKANAGPVSIAFVQGMASVDGKAATVGKVVANKARIETGPNSTMDLVFNERNIIRIAQNSLVVLDFNASSKNLELQKGAATSVLKKLDKLGKQDSFTLKTPLATAGVRGTSFCVWVSQDGGETYICACNGSVNTLDAKGGQEELLESAHHVARVYSKDGNGISKVPGTMLHHDDDSVQAVADQIDYDIDWTKID